MAVRHLLLQRRGLTASKAILLIHGIRVGLLRDERSRRSGRGRLARIAEKIQQLGLPVFVSR